MSEIDKELVEALEIIKEMMQYADHLEDCNAKIYSDSGCDCGFAYASIPAKRLLKKHNMWEV